MKKCVFISLLCMYAFTVKSTEKSLFKNSKLVDIINEMELTEKPIPINPQNKYKIMFTAKATGEYTIKENARIRITQHRHNANSVNIKFYDESYQPLSKAGTNIYILSQKWYKYIEIFYPPTNAAYVRIYLRPVKGESISIKKIALTTNLGGKEKAFINVHPTFEYGDLNSYGFYCAGGGRFYTRPDGKTVWSTGFAGFSPCFPVKSGKYYKLFCKGTMSQDHKAWIWINFYDKDNKKIKHANIKISEEGIETTLKMPKGTVKAGLQPYYIIFEEFQVTEKLKKN